MNGILFKPWKIKAIAENPDREWQTRRLGGLKEINQEPDKWILYDFYSDHGVVIRTGKPNNKGQFVFWQAPIFDSPDGSYKYIKPRYQVGETVYIKEAYRIIGVSTLKVNELIAREAGIEYKDRCIRDAHCPIEINRRAIPEQKWHSPMMMPEWAARYFVKTTDARAEILRLPLSPEELECEGGEIALSILEKINGLWVFVYTFEKMNRYED